jgi:hypothetical protein
MNMKVNNKYLMKLLEAFETSEKPVIDLRDLQKLGFNYEADENFLFHMQFMNDNGFIEREDNSQGFGFDKAADGGVMWSILPLRLTASGHKHLNTINEKNKDDLVEVLYRRGCSQHKTVLLGEAIYDLHQWDKDTYWNTVQALIDDNLIVLRNAGFAVFTLDGYRLVEKRFQQSTNLTQNILAANTVINSSIQQGGAHAKMTQIVKNYSRNDLDDLRSLIEVFKKNINDLALDAVAKQKAKVQIETIKLQIEDEPDLVIVKQAGSTLRNITEGAIGSLIATAAQPTVWAWAAAIMQKLF